jgi:hypothetical protein
MNSQPPLCDLSELLRDAPRERWLTLNREQSKIVGSGLTMEEATAEAKKMGVNDPILFWSPSEWIPQVY